ncbi:MAG: hypothetical protein ACD_2C00067G0003 [uncultured bacterium (gcode 4)]|uniref:Uncharacterized protein n=1 Tax=uncultured bacterium (gcode 4) TaxID=1234023 RepID=K2GHP6_9BACT|nr:MAG: hypothetical protein ACD_2C00067G0003 [uncultured bacterium (gcode 4)]
MPDTIVIKDANSWLSENVLEQKGTDKKTLSEEAHKNYELFKHKEMTLVKIDLLKEKISLAKKMADKAKVEEEMQKIYSEINTDAEANLQLWLYYLTRKDAVKGAAYLKKSLLKSKQFHEPIREFFNYLLIYPLREWKDVFSDLDVLYLVKKLDFFTKELLLEECHRDISEEERTRIKKMLDFLDNKEF